MDESAAQTVRDIFKWKIDGLSPQSIADKLNHSGVPSPLAYKKLQGLNFYTPFVENGTTLWTPKAVIRILGNNLYIGTLTQGIFTTPSYKVKKRVKRSPDEWACIEKSHEAIITDSDYNLVASLMKKDTRAAVRGGAVHLFSGMLYCGDCGYSLVRKTVPNGDDKYIYQVCSNYKNNKNCSSHSLSEPALYDAVLASIRNHLKICVSVSDILRKIDGLPMRRLDIQRLQKQI
ncbi:MAG: recombinase family protein, partial [Clostridiales bacterium]|nr:recombinase family protein [Clostridiales bacterium]